MRKYRDHLATGGFRVEYIEAADLDTSTDLFVKLARKGVSEIHLCDPLEIGLIEGCTQRREAAQLPLQTFRYLKQVTS